MKYLIKELKNCKDYLCWYGYDNSNLTTHANMAMINSCSKIKLYDKEDQLIYGYICKHNLSKYIITAQEVERGQVYYEFYKLSRKEIAYLNWLNEERIYE